MTKTGLIRSAYFMLFLSACSQAGNNANISREKKIEIENGYVPSGAAKTMDVDDYVHWVQDMKNGFRKEKSIAGLMFSAQFKPYEYIVCLEEKKRELADSTVIKKVSELTDMQYYNLKISLRDAEGELLKYQLHSAQEYQERVNYFAFGMQHDIQLVEGTDTLPCILYHFERSFDASPVSTLLLGFAIRKQADAQDKTLLVYDRTFNSGLIKFTFSKKDLKNLPKLKTL